MKILPTLPRENRDGHDRRKRQNITWLYHKSFAIIQSRSRPKISAKYPKDKLVRAVSE